MTEPMAHTNTERRPDWAAFAIGLALWALALLIAWDTSRLGASGAYARIGPQTIPYVIAICLGGLGFWTLLEAWRADFPEREPQEARPVLWIVAGLLVQLLTISFVGFSIATGVLFALVARGFGARRLWYTIPAGILFAGIVWLIFARGLSLTLQHGPFEAALVTAMSAVVQTAALAVTTVLDFFRSFA